LCKQLNCLHISEQHFRQLQSCYAGLKTVPINCSYFSSPEIITKVTQYVTHALAKQGCALFTICIRGSCSNTLQERATCLLIRWPVCSEQISQILPHVRVFKQIIRRSPHLRRRFLKCNPNPLLLGHTHHFQFWWKKCPARTINSFVFWHAGSK
jgi:hypothetical protein